MKWIAITVCLFLIGCATPPKHHKPVRHRSHSTVKVSEADDAATKALIKSLRE